MKILVTGPRGFVGARIMEELKNAVPAPSLRHADEDAIRRMVDQVQPDVIIHTAAISDITTCEKNPEASRRANVEIPLWIAKTGVKLVAFSSDQVYSANPEPGPYTEDRTEDGAAPANLYARHKLEMEQRCLEANENTVLLRAAWMYDMPMYGMENRGNFLVNMLRSRRLSFSSTQHRSVTYVREVAANIRKAMELPGGIYNYGTENELTMLETAQWLKDALELPVVLLDAGPRHALWMNCGRAAEFGITFGSSVEELKQCIIDYGLHL